MSFIIMVCTRWGTEDNDYCRSMMWGKFRGVQFCGKVIFKKKIRGSHPLRAEAGCTSMRYASAKLRARAGLGRPAKESARDYEKGKVDRTGQVLQSACKSS